MPERSSCIIASPNTDRMSAKPIVVMAKATMTKFVKTTVSIIVYVRLLDIG